jgi:hypothetical protein
MKTRLGITKETVFTTRNLLIIAVAVTALTGTNLLLHWGDPPLGYSRYEGFGISFEYSLQGRLQVAGFGWEPTESGGMVQVSLPSNGIEQYGAIWAAPESMPVEMRSPKGALDYISGLIAMDGTTITNLGLLLTMTKDGHEMVYNTFFLMEQGFAIPGIMGSWYCEEAGKYLLFYTIYLPDLENPTVDPQVLEKKWIGYLDLVQCH